MQLPSAMPIERSRRPLRAMLMAEMLSATPPTLASSTMPRNAGRQAQRFAGALDRADENLAQECREHRATTSTARHVDSFQGAPCSP